MAKIKEPATGTDIDTKQVTDPDSGLQTHRQRVIAVGEDGGSVPIVGAVDVGLPNVYPDQHDQPLTDAQLRAAAISVDTGLLQPIQEGGSVTVANQPADPATDATLELIRAQTAAINANTDAVEALLTELRDNQLRRTDAVSLGSQADPTSHINVEANPEVVAAIAEGRMFFGGGQQPSGAGGSSSGEVNIYNPVGSGVDLHIVGFSYSCDTNATLQLINDATPQGTETPLVRSPWHQGYDGFVAPNANLSRGDSTDYAGGTVMLPMRAAANITVPWQNIHIILPEGQSFAIRVTGSGLSASVNLFASVFWYEKAPA